MTTAQPKPEKHKSFLRSSLPFFILAHAAHHFLMALQQPLFPAVRDYFKIKTYKEASVIPMAFALASATGQIPAGWLADRFGPTFLIMVGTLGVAVAGILIGLSQTYVMFLIFLMLMGVLSGGYHPAATPLISASVDKKDRGKALGLHLMGGNAAFFIAPIASSIIIAAFGEDTGWRWSFIILAVPTVVFALIFYMYLVKRGGKVHVEEVRQKTVEEKPPQPGYKRRLIAFLTMMIIGGGIGMSILPFITLYMTDELGASKAMASGLVSIMFFPGLVAGFIGGWLSDKFGSVKIIIITGLLSGITILGFRLVNDVGWGLYLVLFFQGLIMSLRMPVTEVFIMSQAPAKHRSKIFGIYYSTMQYTGVIFVLPGAALLDHFGFDTMFTWSAIGVTVVAVITAFFIADAKDHYNEDMEKEMAAIKKTRDDVMK